MIEAIFAMAVLYPLAVLFGRFVWLPIITAVSERQQRKAEICFTANRKRVFERRLS